MRQQEIVEVVAPLRRVLERLPGVVTEKMHGGIFQSGMPDLLVPCPDGQFCFIECKRGRMRTGADAVDLLNGRQKSLIIRWGLRGLPVWVVSHDKGAAQPWLLWDARNVRHLEGPTVRGFTSPEDLVAAWDKERHDAHQV